MYVACLCHLTLQKRWGFGLVDANLRQLSNLAVIGSWLRRRGVQYFNIGCMSWRNLGAASQDATGPLHRGAGLCSAPDAWRSKGRPILTGSGRVKQGPATNRHHEQNGAVPQIKPSCTRQISVHIKKGVPADVHSLLPIPPAAIYIIEENPDPEFRIQTLQAQHRSPEAFQLQSLIYLCLDQQLCCVGPAIGRTYLELPSIEIINQTRDHEDTIYLRRPSEQDSHCAGRPSTDRE